MSRCGKCVNCVQLEKVRARVLACCCPPFTHADDGVVTLWNEELARLPCLMLPLSLDDAQCIAEERAIRGGSKFCVRKDDVGRYFVAPAHDPGAAAVGALVYVTTEGRYAP